MKISEQELRQMIREVLKRKLKNKNLKEASDFSARRQVVHAAEGASMNFEREIQKTLDMVPVDNLPAKLQKQYYYIAEEMKKKVVAAVMEAARELSKFPKNSDKK